MSQEQGYSHLLPADLSGSLEKFDADAGEVIAVFARELDAQKAPEVIYHYTNDAGLKGILESGKFWLTDIFNLNDPSELRHGFAYAVDALRSQVGDSRSAIGLFAEQLFRFVNEGGIEASAHYFVGSFSSDPDELGQWRAYADNGCGYVLGFASETFEDSFVRKDGKPLENNSTFPVSYNDAILKNIHQKIVELLLPLIELPRGKKLHPTVIQAYGTDLIVSATMNALRPVLFFKHEAYRQEKEFRFLQLFQADKPAPDVKYRSRPNSLVRYREYDWRTSAPKSLKRIIIGPAAEKNKSAQFVKDCLRAFHQHSVEIEYSKIPYRTP